MKVIVFGSDLLATNWAREHLVDRSSVVLATQPDKLLGLSEPVKVVRFPRSVWEPWAHPDKKRVQETEAIIKRVGVSK